VSDLVLTRCADPDEVARRVADVMAAAIDGARTIHGRAHVSLSGGSVVRAYALAAGELPDWRDVHLWYGDERCVPLDDPESNHRAAQEAMHVPDATWHPVPTHLGCEEAAVAYDAEIADVTLDVAINGMGPDGHTASLFPGALELEETRRLMVPVHRPEMPQPWRVSMTMPVLNAGKRVLVLVGGAEKAPMVKRALAHDPSIPAGRLDPAGQYSWILTEDAAAQL
jgi:6-phosphogluconolactonase